MTRLLITKKTISYEPYFVSYDYELRDLKDTIICKGFFTGNKLLTIENSEAIPLHLNILNQLSEQIEGFLEKEY